MSKTGTRKFYEDQFIIKILKSESVIDLFMSKFKCNVLHFFVWISCLGGDIGDFSKASEVYITSRKLLHIILMIFWISVDYVQ